MQKSRKIFLCGCLLPIGGFFIVLLLCLLTGFVDADEGLYVFKPFAKINDKVKVAEISKVDCLPDMKYVSTMQQLSFFRYNLEQTTVFNCIVDDYDLYRQNIMNFAAKDTNSYWCTYKNNGDNYFALQHGIAVMDDTIYYAISYYKDKIELSWQYFINYDVAQWLELPNMPPYRLLWATYIDCFMDDSMQAYIRLNEPCDSFIQFLEMNGFSQMQASSDGYEKIYYEKDSVCYNYMLSAFIDAEKNTALVTWADF